MSGAPDPKPPARVVDRDALRRARLASDECAACRRRAANAHHVIPRSEGGDDVPANIVLVCGSGTMGCHGALHGNPYVDRAGRRWDSEGVRKAIGATIASSRPDTVAYVMRKLGDQPGRAYLRRLYLMEAP